MKNLVILIGRVGADAVIKTFDNGDKIACPLQQNEGQQKDRGPAPMAQQFFRGLHVGNVREKRGVAVR